MLRSRGDSSHAVRAGELSSSAVNWVRHVLLGYVLLGFFSAAAALCSLGCCTPSIGRPLTYRSGYSALCMRSASVGALLFLRPRPAGVAVVTLATGAVSMIISRFSEMASTASTACVLAKRWHRNVRIARRGTAALVQDIAADIGCEGWRWSCRD